MEVAEYSDCHYTLLTKYWVRLGVQDLRPDPHDQQVYYQSKLLH